VIDLGYRQCFGRFSLARLSSLKVWAIDKSSFLSVTYWLFCTISLVLMLSALETCISIPTPIPTPKR